MAGISTGVGLISGLNTAEIVDALIGVQRKPIVRMEDRVKGFENRKAGLDILKTTFVTLASTIQTLGDKATFSAFSVSNSDEAQLKVTAGSSAVAGSYQFQAVRTAAAHEVLSKGFANADQQTVGAGTITIRSGGFLHRPTSLDVLNGGDGVRRGTIRITDRSGASANIDLSNAYSVDDVLEAINSHGSISVSASVDGGKLVLTDTSGSTATNLSVIDISGGHAAEDLGIAKSVASATLSGDDIFEITGDFTFDQLNDGNSLRLISGAPELKITLTDDTVLDIDLDGAASLNDVISRINDHTDNGGKLAASLVNGRLVLEDQSGGGGSSAFTIEDVNSAAVTRQLGLDTAAAGTTITGKRLAGGINSVLLRNLRGGQGIDQLGQITLTDRTGTTATLDLSSAESLDEVIAAINAAESAGAVKLQLTASLNDDGTGIEIRDTSGATASNLVIADVGGSTLAAQLGIAVDAATTSVDSGTLDLRYVNEGTSLSKYSPKGGPITSGQFTITDSAGNSATIVVGSTVKNVGDLLQRINAANGIQVTAALNETGDGFVLIDEAGGSGTLTVTEANGGKTASDLRLLGAAEVGGDGKARITSRLATVVEIDSDDTLNDVAKKINDAGGHVTAAVVNDGSAFNSTRLSLKSKTSGTAGRLQIDTGSLNLGLTTRTEGRNALLRSGEGSAGFLLSSGSNSFTNVVQGVDVTLLKAGDSASQVNVTNDTSKVVSSVKSFVTAYNSLIGAAKELTKFDVAANQKGVLQGDGFVLRMRTRIDSLVTKRFFGTDATFRSLSDIGVRIDVDGKLAFDEERLTKVLAENPQEVFDFFQTKNTGFAAIAKTTVESFTDPFTGAFKTEDDALMASVTQLESRIEELDAILAVRKDRLLLQFYNLETALASLQTQQQALTGLAAKAGQ